MKSVRKNIDFPDDLICKVNKYTKKLNVDFSKFVREATKQYIYKLERAQLQKDLEEGYRAKARLNLKISEDFKYADGESI
jgi:hypothetical protein